MTQSETLKWFLLLIEKIQLYMQKYMDSSISI